MTGRCGECSRHRAWSVLGTFLAGSLFCRGAWLCIEGCLEVSFVSTCQMPTAPPSTCDNQNHLQTLSQVP